jgi:sulfhydrogenase subunit alpha
MPPRKIAIDTITKIEGNAGLKVIIEDEEVKDLQFIISDYRRFFTTAVRGKRIVAVPSFLSRICGTCSVAHLFASLMAIESSQGIAVTEQTKALRRLAYDGLMIRDHGLHLYFFVLPDVLGVDSILDVSDDPDDIGHTLLHDSFDIKRLGTDISNATLGAAIHAPWEFTQFLEVSELKGQIEVVH